VPELAAACAERAAGATHHGAIAFRCLGIDDRRRFAIGAAYFVRHWFPLLLQCNNPFGDDWFRAAPLVICSEVRAAFARLPSLLGPRRNIPRRSELATVWIGPPGPASIRALAPARVPVWVGAASEGTAHAHDDHTAAQAVTMRLYDRALRDLR
jgi:hypothetical protein